MNQEIINRVQADIAKLDQLKVSKIETETKINSLQESLNKDLEAAKELGYNSLDELVAAQQELEKSLIAKCEEVEVAFTSIGV